MLDENAVPPDLRVRSGDRVLVWDQLDVVAFEAKPNPDWKVAELPLSHSQPSWNDVVLIQGVDSFNVCPRGSGRFRYEVTAGRLAEHLQQRTHFTAADLNLGPNARLFMLSSSGGPGVSGGTVLDERKGLIAMYQGGGTRGYSTNWAVRISQQELTQFAGSWRALEKIDAKNKPRLTEAEIDAYAQSSDSVKERATGALVAFDISAFQEFTTAEAFGLGLTAHVYAPIVRSYNSSFGFYGTLTGGGGETSQSFRGPVGTAIVDSLDVKIWDGRLAAGVAFRWFQQDTFRLSAAAAYAAGFRVVEETPEEENRTDLVHGALLRGIPCFAASRRSAFCLVATLGLLNVEKQEYRLALGSTRALGGDRGWVVHGSLGVAYSFGFWDSW